MDPSTATTATNSAMENIALNSLFGNEVRRGATRQMPQLSTMQLAFNWCGLTSPFSRFIFGYTISETIMLIVKPKLCFDSKGTAKNFSIWPSKSGKSDTTIVPWYLPGVAIGAGLALFF